MIWPWYFILDLELWIITLYIVVWAWPKMDRVWRWGAVTTGLVVMALQSLNEVLSRQVFIAWTFSYDYNRMLGFDFLGEPIEEHLFWWAFAWLIPFGYAGLIDWFEDWDQRRGRKAKVCCHE